MAFINKRGRPIRTVRLVLAAALLSGSFSLVTGGGQAAAQTTSEQAAPDPIVFVHGWRVGGGVWNPMIDKFVAAGYRRDHLVEFTYDTNQSNVATANQVRDVVNTLRAQTGANKVDIISHSMGGLSSRYYLKNLGGTAVVDDWVSLAGPNHGTNSAFLCIWFSPSCWDMLPGSGFLNALNAGDETPGDVRYGTWWSNTDEIISPQSSTPLAGAENNFAGSIGHNDFLTRNDVFQSVRGFVA